MNQTSSDKILKFIQANGRGRPDELTRDTNLSRSMVHRILKALVLSGKLQKAGSGPKVLYLPVNKEVDSKVFLDDSKQVIDKNYAYLTPAGELLEGWRGFSQWVKQIKSENKFDLLANEYIQRRIEADSHKTMDGLIPMQSKIKTVFQQTFLDALYCVDFYSIPKFGKTKLGLLVMLAKTSGNKTLMQSISKECQENINKIISLYKVDAVGFIPPSVPRLVQFNIELQKNLNLNRIPTVALLKGFVGNIIQQKSLNSLDARIENAQKTIHLKNISERYTTILLIDDAVGSGATMNEVAKKIKGIGMAKKVIGFAVVGSYKGFDVIPTV